MLVIRKWYASSEIRRLQRFHGGNEQSIAELFCVAKIAGKRRIAYHIRMIFEGGGLTINKDFAKNHCEYWQPGGLCVLMQALKSEDDPRCKYYRDKPERCRYLELFVMKGRGQSFRPKRGGRKHEQGNR